MVASPGSPRAALARSVPRGRVPRLSGPSLAAHDPEGAGLQDQRGRDRGGEGLRDAGTLDRERQDEEESGEREEPEQKSAQDADRGSGPVEVVRESREDGAVERVRRQESGQ